VRVEASRDLPATPERVWEQIRRWEDQSGWIRDAVWVRVLTPEREGVGVRVRVLNRVLLVPCHRAARGHRVEPSRRIVMAHRSLSRHGIWSLSDRRGTRFT
jgi:hypothetical protein